MLIEQRKALAFRCSFCVMSACAIAGCATVPATIKNKPRIGGSFAVRGFPFLGLTWIEVVSVNRAHYIELPGRDKKRPSDVRCSYHSHKVDLVSELANDKINTKRLCVEIAEAVDYVANLSARHPRYHVKVVLSSPSENYIDRSFYLYPVIGRLVFRIPWYSSRPKFSESHVINIVAHETFHVTSRIDRVPKVRRYSEKYAYISGYCSELQVLGKVYLPNSLSNWSGNDTLMQRSDISRSIKGRIIAYRYLSDITISKKYTSNKKEKNLLRKCHKTLRKFFTQK